MKIKSAIVACESNENHSKRSKPLVAAIFIRIVVQKQNAAFCYKIMFIDTNSDIHNIRMPILSTDTNLHIAH